MRCKPGSAEKLRSHTSSVQKLAATGIHYLKQYVIMNKKLKNRIKEFNKIKYPNDNSKRIIVASLNTDIKKLEWGVTQASKNK
jgi:hypothetical protein